MRDRIVAAARELPGVSAAGAGQQLPRLYPPPRPTSVEPMADEPAMAPQPAPGHAVGRGYLEAIGARAISRPPVQRRPISSRAPRRWRLSTSRSCSKFLGGRNPIGRRIRVDDRSVATLMTTT